jgi:hydroxymethylbilane synthase
MATVEGETVTLTGFVGSLDGSTSFRERAEGPADSPEDLGIRLAERLIELGARELLDEARVEAVTATEKVV